HGPAGSRWKHLFAGQHEWYHPALLGVPVMNSGFADAVWHRLAGEPARADAVPRPDGGYPRHRDRGAPCSRRPGPVVAVWRLRVAEPAHADAVRLPDGDCRHHRDRGAPCSRPGLAVADWRWQAAEPA